MENGAQPLSKKSVLWVRVAVAVYLVCSLAAWVLLYSEGDRWWLATLILFGPRWIFSLPLVVLVPLAVWRDRRLLVVLGIAAAVVFGPVMGLRLSFPRPAGDGSSIRVLTCNVGGTELNNEKLRRLITGSGADVVALQECPEDTARKALPDWNVLHDGSLVIASHFPVLPVKTLQTMHPPHRWPRSSLLECRIQFPKMDLTFCCVHLPSPRYGLSNLLDRRVGLNLSRQATLNEEQELRQRTSRDIEELIRTEPLPVVVAGDFNMPVESALYREYWAKYANAFSAAGFGYGLTEKVVIRGFEYKVRIDHILTGGDLSAGSCSVGPDIGSDHLPLIAALRWNPRK